LARRWHHLPVAIGAPAWPELPAEARAALTSLMTQPKTLGQLREIRGIGDAKLQHHEEELLGLVRAEG
jgi:hypothetical protein